MINDTKPKQLSKKWRVLLLICSLAIVSTTVLALLCNTTPTSTLTSMPASTPETYCDVWPMVTGEAIIPRTLEAPPPTQVHPDQLVTVHFSGCYIFINYRIGCGEDGRVGGYAHADKLDWSEYDRTTRIKLWAEDEECEIEFVVPPDKPYHTVVCNGDQVVGYVRQIELPRSVHRRVVSVFLDDDQLVSTECQNECRVEFTVPSDVSPGIHKLKILGHNVYCELEFDIEVVTQSTTTP